MNFPVNDIPVNFPVNDIPVNFPVKDWYFPVNFTKLSRIPFFKEDRQPLLGS